MSKGNTAATVTCEWTGTKVKVKSKEFDKHNHIHMAADENNEPGKITFESVTAGWQISGIEFTPTDGPFAVPTLPATTAVVLDTNTGKQTDPLKYSFKVTMTDESGNLRTSEDPKIVNDPGKT